MGIWLALLLATTAAIGCGTGRTVVTLFDGGGGGEVCALALEPCTLARDCCEGSCELGACALCRSSGRACALSSSCCSGACGASGTCR